MRLRWSRPTHDGISDLTTLSFLHEAGGGWTRRRSHAHSPGTEMRTRHARTPFLAVLHNIHVRYQRRTVYTYSGASV